jgi:RecB family exonuclease
LSLLVEKIASFCREHPLEEKILVVPNRIVGRQITDSVAQALAPGGWINLAAETIGSFAHAVVGETIAGENRKKLSRAQQLAIVEKICKETLGDDSYFGPLRASPGFHRTLSRTIEEMRTAAIDPEALSSESLESARKAADLRGLLLAYQRELAARFIDTAGVLRRAIEALRAAPPKTPPWLLVPVDPKVEGSELELLELAAGERFVRVATDDPERWHESGQRVSLFRAVGEENELRAVLRRAMVAKIPLDQIEILYTSRETYLSLAYELTQQYDIPATFVDRIDVAYTRPGRAVLSFLDWIASGFEERRLRSLLGAVDLARTSESSLLSRNAARILRSAKVGWGRDRYIRCLDALAQRIRTQPSPDPERTKRDLADIEAVAKVVGRLLAAVPLPSANGEISLADVAIAGKMFVEECAVNRSELDGVALVAIPRVLEDLADLAAEPVPLPDALARVREAVAEMFIGGSPVTYPAPGHVHFAGYEDGGYTGRPHTFIVGMDESKHPGAGLQDPVLLDSERRALNAAVAPRGVRLRGEAPIEKARAMRACLARLRGNVTLSFSCRELSDGREQFPAGMLLEVYRDAQNPEADQRRMLEDMGPAAGFLPDSGPLDTSEWWLSRLPRPGIRRDRGAESALAAYPWLGQGRAARAARESGAFTIYDGGIPSAGTSLDPRESREPVSASRLEALASCPFAYFLRYILKIEPVDELERDDSVWLGPQRSGSLLHELFREFMAEMKAKGRKPSLARDRVRLIELAEAALAREQKETPPPADIAYEFERMGILRACETFLRSEEEETKTLTPHQFEVAFGGANDPVEISIGHGRTLLIRGSIDRVDLCDDGQYEVWDYKTGSDFGFDRAKELDSGRRMQHAIYACVFEALLRKAGLPGSVSRAGYIFVGSRGDGHRHNFGYGSSDLCSLLDRLCDVTKAGAFLHGSDTKNDSHCVFCPYESVCGGRTLAGGQAIMKLADSANSILDAARNLYGSTDGG